MHVALIFPPLCDPRAPQLALPSLAAFLRKSGVEVSLHDLNLTGILDLFSNERLLDTYSRLLGHAKKDFSSEVMRSLPIAERLIKSARYALRDLRCHSGFFDPMRYADARNTLNDVLRTTSLAYEAVDARISPIRYDLRGLTSASLKDLAEAAADARRDIFAPSTTALLSQLAKLDPVLVGVTITNRQQMFPGLILARQLRSAGHFVVLGGAVFSKFREELQAAPAFFRKFADAVVVYEGETALLALAHAVASAKRFSNVPNLLYLDGIAIRATPTHVENVPSLPTPDFLGLPLDDYLAPAVVLPILTGKGCYFNKCKFCDIPFINHVSKKAYRIRPVDQVVADVHTLHARHGVSNFVITDEALSPRLLGDLADAFARHPGDFAFTGYARPEPGFTAELCKKIAALGIRKLFFGLESGSQRMLDHMDKGIRVDRVPTVLANCRDAGIDFHLFSMVGLPQESQRDADATVQFFVDNASVIDSPGSSFDMHTFGLELRTRYFLDRSAYGLTVNPSALGENFVIGLNPQDWVNTGGLTSAEANRLISTQYASLLRRTFQTWHASPDPIWPPQEEYSLLYSRHYDDLEFSWQTRLPPGEEVAFQFVPSETRMGAGDDYELGCIVNLDYAIRLPVGLMRLMLNRKVLTWRQHLEQWPDSPSPEEIRSYVDALVQLGLLIVRIPTSVAQDGSNDRPH